MVEAIDALQVHPEVEQLCTLSVLRSRLRDPEARGLWDIRAMPMPEGVFHCIGSRFMEGERTGSLFRAGP